MPHAIDVSLDASIDAVMSLQPHIEAFCEAHGLSSRTSYTLQLVLEELLTNVVNHGYKGTVDAPIVLKLSHEGEMVVGEIIDSGSAFDPTDQPEPDIDAPMEDRRIGGLGVFLSKTMTHDLSYARVDGRNVVRFRLTDDPPQMENNQ